MDRAIKRIDAYGGRLLHQRAQKAYLEGGRLMEGPMRAAARGMFIGRGTRGYKRTAGTIRAKRPRLRTGKMAAVSVGPRTGLRFIIVRGTKEHSLAMQRKGKSAYLVFPDGGVRLSSHVQHPGSGPRPFVEQTYRAMGSQVRSFIARETLRVGETGFRHL